MLGIESAVELRGGRRMPLLGLGVFGSGEGAECERAVATALEVGYRHVDTAAAYRNERSVGSAVRASGVPREEVFVTTKIPPGRLSAERARSDLEASLERLGMDHVDLALIHWPVREGTEEAWGELRAMRDEGLARSIGVSNFTVERFERQFLPRVEEVPAVNQIELHPFLARKGLLDYCRAKGIQVEGYSPLARASRLGDPVLGEIARRHGKTVAQVMIRWQLELGVVTIPKSSDPERIRANADVYDFELSPEEMAGIDSLDEGLFTITWRPEEGWF